MAGYRKGKRKGGIALLLGLVFLFLFGAGTCFAYPYIETALSPKAQVLTALKGIGEEYCEKSEEFISELKAMLTTETDLEGQVSFTRAELDGTDYLEEFGYSKAEFKLTANAQKQSVSGTVGAESTDSEKKKEAQLHLDRQTLKEELTKAGYGEVWHDIEVLLDFVDADTMNEYIGVAERMNIHMQSAVKVLLDKSSYTKNGKEVVEVDKEQVNTTKYTVTISKEAMLAAFEEFFNQVYSDSSLTSYTTMFATFTGYSRNDLTNISKEIFEDMTYVDIAIYLNKDKEPVKLDTEFDTGFCIVAIEMQGMEIFDITVRYHEESDNPYGYVHFKLENINHEYICREGAVILKADEHKLFLEFTGKFSYKIKEK